MRTPRGKRAGKEKGGKTEVNKLRKKAMKNKMMKKTMLTLAGDETKDEFRDLINESNLSNISIIGRSPARQPRKPAAKSVKKSASKKTLKPSESLNSLKAQLSRRRSKRNLKAEMNGSEVEEGESRGKKVKLVKPADTVEPTTNGADHTEDQAPEQVSRLQGVRNMLSSAVWGVPYAKVAEDTEPLNTSRENASRCVIS